MNCHFKESDGCLVVELGSATASAIAEIFRAFAARCVKNEVKRALVRPGDDGPGGELALRNACTMMLLAGIPAGFRIALYSPEREVEAKYLPTVRDLRLANVNAMWFTDKAEALAWLTGVGARMFDNVQTAR